MKETTSSSANDPRLPSAAKPYVPPTLSPQDLPIDYAGFLAVVFGVVGVTLRGPNTFLGIYHMSLAYTSFLHIKGICVISSLYIKYIYKSTRPYFVCSIQSRMIYIISYKLCSWLAIIFCAQSLANMKNFENDFKQLSMAFMFGVMGLVTNYLGPSRAAKQR
ncbi:unnamed protein product [Musa hybrid cultivar]